MSGLRPLSNDEITRLVDQGCSCTDWSVVEVAEGFDASRVRSTELSGRVQLGAFAKDVRFFGGVTKPAGIYNATLHNCVIGNNVYIGRVGSYIANYVIEDDVIIDNVDLVAVDGLSTFGNGIEIAVVNEAGGREIPMCDRLSSHIGYIIAFYRHRPDVITKLKRMIRDYTETVASSMGRIGAGARVINSRIIKNTVIGPAGVIEGVNRLENGSVNSRIEDPVYIGPGVYAEDFIACSGSRITDGTILSRCFVGQGTVLSKQYSAENSVFFANCGGFHGEACAVFAGPFTVTHHKSTLLIAGLFSFLNAGSGTNQSNHRYKLGPVHQGIVERGSKTGSDSYMLWPAKVGPFTVVMGRHYHNSDTSDLPFSYLIEHEDESILAPGVNLRSVGSVRDARKWPTRDRREDPDRLDHIHFQLLSPYTIQKMFRGRDLLRNLEKTSGATSDYFTYHSVKIPGAALRRGIELYETGIDKYLGNCLIKRLQDCSFESSEELTERLKNVAEVGAGEWVDLAGLLTPVEAVGQILSDVEDDSVTTLEQLARRFRALADDYPLYEWAWAANALERRWGKKVAEFNADDVIAVVRRWQHAVVSLDQKLRTDAEKEFAALAQTGYGMDGDGEAKVKDFESVRGRFDADDFVVEIDRHIRTKSDLGNEVIRRMERMRELQARAVRGN